MTLRTPVIRVIMRIYLDFLRIMPQLAWLFIAVYGLARAWTWNLAATGACVFVIVLWGGAELGDHVRGALDSSPAIQFDSSYMLGLSNSSRSMDWRAHGPGTWLRPAPACS